MTWAVPKSIVSDVISRLNRLAISVPFDPSPLDQIEFQSRGLARKNPFYFYSVGGMIAALKRDPAGVERAFSQARKFVQPVDLGAFYNNFVISFASVGSVERASELSLEALDVLPPGHSALEDIASSIVNRGRFDLYAKLREKAGPDPSDQALYESFRALEQRGIDGQLSQQFIARVYDFLEIQGIRRTEATLVAMNGPDEPGPCLIFRMSVPLDPEKAVVLEDSLFDFLFATSDPVFETNGILVQFDPTLIESHADIARSPFSVLPRE